MAALQTTEAQVPGSNPAYLRVKNSEEVDRQSHCVLIQYCKISGQRGKPPLRPKQGKDFFSSSDKVMSLKVKICNFKSVAIFVFKACL